ncbi:MAG: bifunctional phosphoribosylaminoimidazolecarboxamide formyltransferase/IMP cyclohydrolase, partial [Chloroflexota bacterium]|nr:bifunctional phosphoribosylaminoimidazolecarboxamide formyltransferase/IMP cyclohydrolase [Chloroflexota bacterium]
MAAPRALISVYDKTGLEDLAAGLAARGWDFVASGGTAATLAAAGHTVSAVEDVTGAPEMLDGRVKTLHPAVHGGILARRSSDEHLAELTDLGIGTIDLVAVNLYPFAATLAATDDRAELLENIDIGGVALIRAAAKNADDVWILVDPADYPRVLEAMEHTESANALRRELAAKAFALTAFYDAHIAAYLQQDLGQSFPEHLTIPLRRLQSLRYGENPHQPGAFYAAGAAELGDTELAGVEQLHGLELSYINILDLQAAWASANDFDDIAVSIIKHTMPCCLATHPESQVEAYRRARETDPISAFGGILGFNRTVTSETVAAMRGHLYHVIVAPDYEPAALRRLRRRKDLRIMRWPAAVTRPPL